MGQSVLNFWHLLGHEREDSKDEAVLHGQDHGSRVSGVAKLMAQTMLTSSVAFVDVLSAFPSTFYGELANDENKTICTEARSLVCSIVRRIFEDIALHRRLARVINFKGG
jgi:hypothetical protein